MVQSAFRDVTGASRARSLAGSSHPLKEKVERAYFGSYSGLAIHREMLSDTVRTRAYMDALEGNPGLIGGARVLGECRVSGLWSRRPAGLRWLLSCAWGRSAEATSFFHCCADVGCGTGVLSMFAARGGARRVVGVDGSQEIAALAEANVKANGMAFSDGGVVSIVAGTIEDINKREVSFFTPSTSGGVHCLRLQLRGLARSYQIRCQRRAWLSPPRRSALSFNPVAAPPAGTRRWRG